MRNKLPARKERPVRVLVPAVRKARRNLRCLNPTILILLPASNSAGGLDNLSRILGPSIPRNIRAVPPSASQLGCVLLAGKASLVAFRIPFHPNRSSALTLPSSRFPLRSRYPAISSSVLSPHCVSRATIPHAYAPRQADWRRCRSGKASLERFDRCASRAHTSLHGHCGNRHPQLSPARVMPLGYDPANVMKIGIHCTARTQASGTAFSRAKRVPFTSSRFKRR